MALLAEPLQTEIFGLSIKAKVGSTFHTVKPSVNINGNWRPVIKAYVKVGGVWQTTYEYEYVYQFVTGDFYDVDLDNLSLDKTHNVKIVINSGARLLASSTSAYALRTGTGYGGALTIENNGAIWGASGNGGGGGLSGSGANAGAAGGDGGDGGDALYVECPLTFSSIAPIGGGGGGGGGGSGGGGSGWPSYGNYYAGGGGGGGGQFSGLGGPKGSGSQTRTGSVGGNGLLYRAGYGGAGSCHSEGCGSAGANGGDFGQAGSSGAWGTGSFRSAGGAGGAAGAAYFNPQNYQIILL